MGRRGYAPFTWLVVGAVFGPFVIPVALGRMRDARRLPALPNRESVRRGPVDVLVGLDGSPESLRKAEVVANLIADRIGRLTLAAVVDYDTALGGAAAAAHRGAEHELSDAATRVRKLGYEIATVLLAGRRAQALGAHRQMAASTFRGRKSRARRIETGDGQRTSTCSRQAPVPVLIVTNNPETASPSTG